MTSTRHQAREAALQILYFAEVGRVDSEQALETFFREHDPDAGESQRAFAAALVRGTLSDLASLDKLIAQHSEHWRVERMAVIDRLILRMAAWELQHESATPVAVVLNEAIELARAFGTDDSVRFVNGVLDGIRKTVRGLEA